MKKTIYFLLVSLVAIFCVSACEKENSEEDNLANELKVVKTVLDMDYSGGTGVIEMNTKDITAFANKDWIKVTCSGNDVNLEISANDTYSARTGIVHISSGDQVQRVPITQIGIISVIKVHDHEFDYHGGEVSFQWKTHEQFQIDNVPAWLSYEIVGDEIKFTAKSFLEDAGADNFRKADVQITVGKLFSEKVCFSQEMPFVPYETVLGKYKLQFATWHNNTRRYSADVEFKEDVVGKSFILTGLGFTVKVLYDPDESSIEILEQVISAPTSDRIHLAPWDAGPSGNLKWNCTHGLKGSCKDRNHIVFTMSDNGRNYGSWKDENGNNVLVDGFILWGEKTRECKLFGYSRFVDLVFTKL